MLPFRLDPVPEVGELDRIEKGSCIHNSGEWWATKLAPATLEQ